jgi:hypothetical protein
MKMKLAALFAALLLWASASVATTVTAVVGDVQLIRGGVSQPVAVGTLLLGGDELVSGEASEAIVRFEDGGRIAMRASSRMLFRQLPPAGAPPAAEKIVTLVKGALRYVSSKLSRARTLQFETTSATIGMRGTDIEILFSDVPIANEPAGTLLRVREGEAYIRGADGTQTTVRPGQVAFGGEPDPPTRSIGAAQRPGARLVNNPRAAAAFPAARLDEQLR